MPFIDMVIDERERLINLDFQEPKMKVDLEPIDEVNELLEDMSDTSFELDEDVVPYSMKLKVGLAALGNKMGRKNTL